MADQSAKERPIVTVRGLVPDEQGRLLFIYEKGPNLWVPPGGRLEHGEEMYEAIEREVYEETGYKTKVDKFAFVYDQVLGSIDWHVVQMYFLMQPVLSSELNEEWEDLDTEYDYGVRRLKFMSLEDIKNEEWVEPQFISDFMMGNLGDSYIPYIKTAQEHEDVIFKKRAQA
ncbi:MAG: hypothetical protein CMP22_00365 [Rickettsiales bacterium]|nr:hypothetical protein [Rickettsiales bacterium]|tara:strand:+ start:665 stop:1177 length:513 start_codon:yes stop_codon:yes gene_type:complete